MSLQIRLVRVETGTEGRKGRRYSQAAMRWPAASRWPAAAQRHQRASSVPSRGGRERCAGATAPSAAAETWWRQGTAPGRWGDGGAKGQRRREQARLAPRGEWERGFGAGAGDLTQEVGELPRARGIWRGKLGESARTRRLRASTARRRKGGGGER